MQNGAFQVSRCIYQSDIFLWKPARWFKVWIYILGTVNHTDGKQFKRGQGWFTYDKIYIDCNLADEGLKKTAIDNMIRRMKKEQNITTHKTTRGFVITVLNYDKYQTFNNYKNDTQNDRQTKHKRNTNDTITKEGKNDKNDKKKKTTFSPPTLNEVKDYFTSKGYTEESGERAFEYYNVAGWVDSQGKQVRNWKQKMNSVWFKEENKKKEMTMDQRLALYNKMGHVPFRIKYGSEKATEVKLYSL